jgi:hypothetical protein
MPVSSYIKINFSEQVDKDTVEGHFTGWWIIVGERKIWSGVGIR